jgi:triosephosphate isomerase
MSRLGFPLLLINFKAYREALGRSALRLASMAERASRETGVCVAVAPQAVDLRLISEAVKIPVFAQHVDLAGYGKYTGHLSPEAVVDAGCVGSLISHSERRLSLELVGKTVERASEAGLITVVCADTVERCRAVAAYSPTAVAVEPPELIGTGIPVSKAKPEVVSGAVKAVKGVDASVRVLCGAGITRGVDVEAAVRLGAEGVLVASGVVKASDPYRVMVELASAMRP